MDRGVCKESDTTETFFHYIGLNSVLSKVMSICNLRM